MHKRGGGVRVKSRGSGPTAMEGGGEQVGLLRSVCDLFCKTRVSVGEKGEGVGFNVFKKTITSQFDTL